MNTTLNKEERIPLQLTIREPGSAITHLIGMVLAILGAIPLLVKAAVQGGPESFISSSVFIISMILLYGASATYHSVNLTGEALKVFKRMDHMMIFVLIAGSYTPTCMLILPQPLGHRMLAVVWAIALLGMLFKFFWVTCPKWVSSVLYIGMGWVVIFAVKPLYEALPLPAFLWLLAGGIVYTAGGVIYALKLPLFNSLHKNFGSHEIFHLFVMGGSLCHYIFTYFYVL
ncbi:MAG: hemolysin III family protein [Lachnospiraceae bacterium]|nr:hemolysin III family protein [Lachnospiraceae bacterium]